MARNRKGGGRIGAVRGRSQFQLPNGHYAKRDTRTGEILSVKADLKPYKGIVKEKPVQQPAPQPRPARSVRTRPVFPPLQTWEWSVRRQERPEGSTSFIEPASSTGMDLLPRHQR